MLESAKRRLLIAWQAIDRYSAGSDLIKAPLRRVVLSARKR
jgi:hypothetical protein